MTKTAIFRHPSFLEHDPGRGHVESPDRLAVIYAELDKGLLKNCCYPEFAPATKDILALNHGARYIAKVAATSERLFSSLDPDTSTSPGSYHAACLAVGALIQGTDMLMAGDIDNCFALVRPPGHHAEKDRAMGFCLFNNIAVAAAYAVAKKYAKKVLIVDWDLHHGNGTQNSFYNTSSVLYFSSHQYPYFPGSGALLEVGSGKGQGFTVNIPLPGGQNDADFVAVFEEILVPVARAYRPDIIMVSAGFDIFRGDPLGTMRVTPAGFAAMTTILRELAGELCQGRLLLTLEGGYSLGGLRDGVMACLEVLSGVWKGPDIDNSCRTIRLEQARNVLHPYWLL